MPSSRATSSARQAATHPAPLAKAEQLAPLSRRAYSSLTTASSWEELWEAGSYYERLAELLEDAEHHAIFVGWQVDSRVPMIRPERPGHLRSLETLKEKVIRLCDARPNLHIYFLMWDHAYFYCLERETMQGRVWDGVHPRVHFVFDNRHPFGASHHEKVVLIDGKAGFCGGIDVCDERWDSPNHLFTDPRRSLTWKKEHHGPYHDLAVQVTGPVCRDMYEHVASRWRSLTSIPFPEFPREPLKIHGGHRVYVSRTVAGIDAGERGVPIVREIEFLFEELIARARRRIIMEGQYYWSRAVNDALITRMKQLKGQPFEILLVLADLGKLKSLTRQMSVCELKLLRDLEATARETGTKITIGFPQATPQGESRERAKPVYVHSKLIIIDDDYLCIGSANLAARALRVDTEIQLTLEASNEAERAHIRRVADQVKSHWNVAEDPENHVHLRPFHFKTDLERVRPHLIFISLPWQRFFDPELPWLYFLKRRFRKLEKTRSAVVAGGLALIWMLGVLATLAMSGVLWPDTRAEAWAELYCVILYSTWYLPVPFVATSLLATLHLGPVIGAQVSVSSLWTAALTGYVLTRMFPTPASRYFRKTAPAWVPERIGLRDFPFLISVLADPRVGIRSKIAYQGLYSVPAPWFAFSTLAVLPGAIYVVDFFVGNYAPAFLTKWVGAHAAYTTAAIGIWIFAQMAPALNRRRSRMKDGK